MTLDKFGSHILNRYTRDSDLEFKNNSIVNLVNISEAKLYYVLVLPFDVKYQQEQFLLYKYPFESGTILSVDFPIKHITVLLNGSSEKIFKEK